MTEDEAIPLVTGLICKARHVDPSQLSTTANLVDDIGFDSLDAAELLAALHRETGIQLDVDSLKGMHTVRDIARGLVHSMHGQEVGSGND